MGPSQRRSRRWLCPSTSRSTGLAARSAVGGLRGVARRHGGAQRKQGALGVWSAVRWVGVRRRCCKRMQAHGWRQFGSKFEVGWRRGFRKYERAGERHERAQAVGLGFGGRACIRLSERASLQPPADERAWPMSSIRHLSSKSQLRSIRSLNWPANRSSLKRPIRKFEIRIIMAATVYY
jgi:hypothetical protein